MEIKEFYEFGSKFSSAGFKSEGLNMQKGELADQWKLIKGEYDGISFPVTFKQYMGKRLKDVLNTGWPGLYLISDKLKANLEKSALTGWKTFPIKLLTKDNSEISGYQGLSITGRCGPIDYTKSEIIEKRSVPNGPLSKYYKGLYIGLDKWDGTDFFLPGETFHTIITEKAALSLKRERLTNIIIENLSGIETWERATRV